MNITLKDIERAEQILEAYRSGDMESLSANDIQFVSQPMLPAMLKLVREILPFVEDWSLEQCIERMPKEARDDCGKCTSCKARRLVERLEA